MIATIFLFFFFLFLLIGTIEGKMNIIEIVIIIWLFDTFSYLGGKIIEEETYASYQSWKNY